jgi:hypothetical protein
LLRRGIAKYQNARITFTEITAALQFQSFGAVQRHGRALRIAGQRD